MSKFPFKVGFANPVYDLSARSYGSREWTDTAVRAENLGFDSVFTLDHYSMDYHTPAGRCGAPDPFLLLSYAAAKTERIELGVLAACAGFRSAGQLGREINSLSEASDGRVIVVMGAGWNDAEYNAFGHPTDHRASRLREQLQVLGPLARQEEVDFHGKFVELDHAQLLLAAPDPTIWVAAVGPKMLEVTATYGDGWNHAWFGPDTTEFEGTLSRFRDAQKQVDRDPDDVEISVGLRIMPVSGPELAWTEKAVHNMRPYNDKGEVPFWWSDPISEEVITGSDQQIIDAIYKYRELGVDHVVITPGPTPFLEWNSEYLDRIASLLPSVR